MKKQTSIGLSILAWGVAGEAGRWILDALKRQGIRPRGLAWIAVFGMFVLLGLAAHALATKLTPQNFGKPTN